jgi:hypothetical protein
MLRTLAAEEEVYVADTYWEFLKILENDKTCTSSGDVKYCNCQIYQQQYVGDCSHPSEKAANEIIVPTLFAAISGDGTVIVPPEVPDNPAPADSLRDAFAQIEAEDFDTANGVSISNTIRIGDINNGDWAGYKGIDFSTKIASGLEVNAGSAGAGGTVEVHLDSPDGTLLGSCAVTPTGGWGTFQTFTGSVSGSASGMHDIYLVFKGGSGALLDVNWFRFIESSSVPVTIVTPEAGKAYVIGQPMFISWKVDKTLVTAAMVSVSFDDGASWNVICKEAINVNDSTSMNWIIPDELGGVALDKTTAIIKIYDYMEQDRFGMSGAFTITNDVKAETVPGNKLKQPTYVRNPQQYAIDIPQGEYVIEVYSLQGRNLFSWSGKGPQRIDLQKMLPPGIHILSFQELTVDRKAMRTRVVAP